MTSHVPLAFPHALQAVRALAQAGGVSVVEVSKHDLNMVTDNRPHQASWGQACLFRLCCASEWLLARSQYRQRGDLAPLRGSMAATMDQRRAPEGGCESALTARPLLVPPPENFSEHAQGLVLDCEPLEFEMLSSFPDPPEGGRGPGGKVPLWLVLDEVMDPVSSSRMERMHAAHACSA